MSIPLTAKDLTDEWLESALRDGGALAESQRIRVRSIDPVVTGAAGQSFRVAMELVGAPGPATTLRLIAKLPTTNPDIARANQAAGWSVHESTFYRVSAPRLAVRTPRCYFSAVEPNGQAVLLLEDLAADATLTAGDLDAGCSRQQAEGVLRVLATLHHPSAIASIDAKALPPPFMHLAAQRQGADPRASRWTRWLADRGQALGERARRVGDTMARGNGPALRRVAETHPVLLHGDCKADNMLFSPGGDPAVFDWQLVSRGAGAFDVAFFLSTSVSRELRREIEATSLRTYHAAAGVTLTYDAWFELYRHCVNVGFYRTATSISLHSAGTPHARALMLILGERQCAAIEDLETDDCCP